MVGLWGPLPDERGLLASGEFGLCSGRPCCLCHGLSSIRSRPGSPEDTSDGCHHFIPRGQSLTRSDVTRKHRTWREILLAWNCGPSCLRLQPAPPHAPAPPPQQGLGAALPSRRGAAGEGRGPACWGPASPAAELRVRCRGLQPHGRPCPCPHPHMSRFHPPPRPPSSLSSPRPLPGAASAPDAWSAGPGLLLPLAAPGRPRDSCAPHGQRCRCAVTRPAPGEEEISLYKKTTRALH